eukprot:4624195-Prymnesium_polylepis.1
MSKCTNEMNMSETTSAQTNANNVKKIPAEKPLSEGECPPTFTFLHPSAPCSRIYLPMNI